MSMLSPEELSRLAPAESLFPSPIPVQSVSSDEFMPGLQTQKQRAFEARVKTLGAQIAKRLGMSRRRFFQSAAGMAAAFLAMNDTYGPVFGVTKAEACRCVDVRATGLRAAKDDLIVLAVDRHRAVSADHGEYMTLSGECRGRAADDA